MVATRSRASAKPTAKRKPAVTQKQFAEMQKRLAELADKDAALKAQNLVLKADNERIRKEIEDLELLASTKATVSISDDDLVEAAIEYIQRATGSVKMKTDIAPAIAGQFNTSPIGLKQRLNKLMYNRNASRYPDKVKVDGGFWSKA